MTSTRRAALRRRPRKVRALYELCNMFWIFVVMFSGFLLLCFLDFCCYVFWIFVVMFSGFLLLCFLDFCGINFWIFVVLISGFLWY